MNTTLVDVAQALRLDAPARDIVLSGVGIDTRRLQPGGLYVALRGARFDGHDFVASAAEQGAAAALVERALPVELPQLVVADSRRALGLLAAHWRRRMGLPLVAVTGSNGKTTVKELIASMLRTRGPVLATEGNLNNDIGVPLTLLRLTAEHRYAVIEMGANHAGEIAWLTEIAGPDVALITNAGPAHLEGFGDLDGVARAKAEIYGGLGPDGVAVINADDAYAGLWRQINDQRRRLTFSLGGAADLRAERTARPWGSELRVDYPGGSVEVSLPLLGAHNARNAVAAAAAVHALGLDADALRAGLEAIEPVPGRLCPRPGPGGSRLIDDSYNANPASLLAGAQVLAELPGRRWLALGDMGELGDDAVELHRRAGADVRAQGIERLFALGELAEEAAAGFGPGASGYEDLDVLVAALRSELRPDVTLLIKGSRAAGMDRVADALAADASEVQHAL